MTDAVTLIAECEALAAQAVPVEVAASVAAGTCEQGCCRRLSLIGVKRSMYFDLPPVAAQVLALRLAPELTGKPVPKPSVN